MPKRHIRPHKGGRTARLPGVRLHPDTLVTLRDVCDALNLSIADWVKLHAGDDGARLAMCRLQDVMPTPDVVMRGKIAVGNNSHGSR